MKLVRKAKKEVFFRFTVQMVAIVFSTDCALRMCFKFAMKFPKMFVFVENKKYCSLELCKFEDLFVFQRP